MTNTFKWLATTICIIGAFINAMGIYPLGPIILLLGGVIWLGVSIAWKENSLIITNIAMTLVTVIGLIINE